MGTAPEPEDAKQERVDGRLAQVAKILAGVFVAIAGAGAAFGLSQDTLLTAVNNNILLFIGVAALALGAVGLSIWSLFQGKNKEGNIKQSGLLGLGVGFYLGALLLALWGVANVATGNGRPNITDISVERGSDMKVTFTVHADGVKGKEVVIAEIEAFKGEAKLGGGPVYRTLLHADDKGDVNQKVIFIFSPGEATHITIWARPDHVNPGSDGACDASKAEDKLGCATILLPKK
ncbi:hypothetical protein ACFWTC_31670 [Streptomyces sp. NPDC058619]|uniref:hypothetical protein n=1 Tax=unclassified Streptomyces TaxID=2593676 RepID=UPI003661FF9E